MSTLEQIIEKAASNLPPGWRLKIEAENGWAGVVAIRPDGTEVSMDTGEDSLAEQVVGVLALARDEIAADAMAEKAVRKCEHPESDRMHLGEQYEWCALCGAVRRDPWVR